MLILTALLLAIGTLVASFGTLGFTLHWVLPDPDHHSLGVGTGLATTGRRLAATGLALYIDGHGLAHTAMILTVAAACAATYLTRTTTTITTGATP